MLSVSCLPYGGPVRKDISFAFDRILRRSKRFVRRQDQTVGIVDQRVSGYSGNLPVRPGKAAVDHDQLTAAFYRAFTF